MKILAATADVEAIRRLADAGLIDGIDEPHADRQKKWQRDILKKAAAFFAQEAT